MSINIQTVADKTIYENHFQDAMTMPINSQIALTKCNMEVPVFVQNVLRVPSVGVVDYTKPLFLVAIDGLQREITYQDFFNAHNSLIGLIEPGMNIATFYSGNYEIFTNNNLTLARPPPAAGDSAKPTFSAILGKAIDREYDFYSCIDISAAVSSQVNVGGAFGQSIVGDAGTVYNQSILRTNYQNQISLNITYNPEPIAQTTPTTGIFDGFELLNWSNTTLGVLNNASGNSCFASTDFEIDNNGGYLTFTPNIALSSASQCAVGFNLSGIHTAGPGHMGVLSTPTAVNIPSDFNLIDIGVLFEANAAGTQVKYRIIDGNYDESGTKYIQTEPALPLKNYTNNSHIFSIQMVKSDMNNADGSIVFRLYQGTQAAPLQANFIYQFKTTMASSSQLTNSLFLCDTAAHELKGIQYVAMTNQTRAQNNSTSFVYGLNDSFSISASLLQFRPFGITDFIAATGIDSDLDELVLATVDPYVSKITNQGTRFNKTLTWKTNWTSGDATNTNISYYFLGLRNMADFYTYAADPNTGVNRFVVRKDTSTTTLPKELSVFINNLDIKNYSGTFSSLTGANTQTGITRLVSTVPLRSETNVLASENLTIDYEVFNPYFRPISNPNNFTINQLMIEISYKDFATDQRKTIDNINGLVRCEFNVRGGLKTNKKMNNELLPFI